MKAMELKELTDDELGKKKEEFRSELMNLRFQDARKVLENPARVKLLRRDVARVETILHGRVATNKPQADGGAK